MEYGSSGMTRRHGAKRRRRVVGQGHCTARLTDELELHGSVTMLESEFPSLAGVSRSNIKSVILKSK